MDLCSIYFGIDIKFYFSTRYTLCQCVNGLAGKNKPDNAVTEVNGGFLE